MFNESDVYTTNRFDSTLVNVDTYGGAELQDVCDNDECRIASYLIVFHHDGTVTSNVW